MQFLAMYAPRNCFASVNEACWRVARVRQVGFVCRRISVTPLCTSMEHPSRRVRRKFGAWGGEEDKEDAADPTEVSCMAMPVLKLIVFS